MGARARKRTGLLLATLLLAGTLACAGGRGQVDFDALEVPASMSGYLHDERGRKLSPKAFEVVGEFRHEARLWGLLYSLVPLGAPFDAAKPINADVTDAGGEGVINMRVTSEGCVMNYIPALSLLPIWPGCADVVVQGEIVKRKGKRGRRAGR